MTAGKPKLGFWATLAAGLTNIVLDALFVAVLGWGVVGAAWATVAGMAVGSLIPLVYFARKESTPLRIELRAILLRQRRIPKRSLKTRPRRYS